MHAFLTVPVKVVGRMMAVEILVLKIAHHVRQNVHLGGPIVLMGYVRHVLNLIIQSLFYQDGIQKIEIIAETMIIALETYATRIFCLY